MSVTAWRLAMTSWSTSYDFDNSDDNDDDDDDDDGDILLLLMIDDVAMRHRHVGHLASR